MSYSDADRIEAALLLLDMDDAIPLEQRDPLTRLLDPAFTAPVWEYEHSYIGPELPGSLHAKQEEALRNPSTHRHLYWGNQAGKLQDVDEPVLTPTGWCRIGALRPGDALIAGDGSVTTVSTVAPQGSVENYRVTFDDGSWTLCGAEHLWVIRDPSARFNRPGVPRGDGYDRKGARFGAWRVATLDEMRRRWGDRPRPKQRCAIPVVSAPVAFPSQPVAIDPYVLGVLLGDGGMTDGAVRLTSADAPLVAEVRTLLPHGHTLTPAGTYGYRVKGVGGVNTVTVALRAYGLMGCGSSDKFVPTAYLWNDAAMRLAVLQGLLDTDGSCGRNGHVEYTSVSPDLRDAVVFLVQSLGGKAAWTARTTSYTYKGVRRQGKPSYRVRVRLPRTRLFRLARKHSRCIDPVSTCDERVVYRIESVGPRESVCIRVAHPSGTYLTRDCIVTHNSTIGAVDMVLSALGRHPLQLAGKEAMPNQWAGWASALSWELWENILLPELLTWIPRGRILRAPTPRQHSQNRDVVFRADNGTVSRITGKASEQGAEMYQSARVHKVWLDEEHPESVWDEMQPRLLRFGGRTMSTMTPLKGMGTYIYGRIYEPLSTGRMPKSRHWFSHASVLDNPGIRPESVDEMTAELAHSPSQLEARLHGHFARPTGAVYSFDLATMGVDMDSTAVKDWLPGCNLYGGIDLGKWRFAFAWGGVDSEGVYTMVDEVFSQAEGVDVRARRIHEQLQSHGVSDITLRGDCADPLGIRDLNAALDRLDSPYRVTPVDGRFKARKPGVQRVESLMHRGAFRVRRGLGTGKVWRLGMSASTPGKPVEGSRWLWEVANWQYPTAVDGKVQTDDPDDATADGADMMDATRYLVMTWLGPLTVDEPVRALTVLQRLAAELRDLDDQEDVARTHAWDDTLRQG